MIVFLLFAMIPMISYAQDVSWFEKGLETTDPKEKIEFFTRSIREESDPAPAYFCRAAARLDCGDIRGAIEDYTICIGIDPNDAGAWFSRGMIKQNISIDLQDAMADIVKAFELDPANPGYINQMNEMYLKKEDYDGAIIFYHKILEFYPDNATIFSNLGYCYLALNDYSSALENFGKYISLQPENVTANLYVALICYYQNDFTNAKKYLDRAKSLKPILNQGIPGFETFKKEGHKYNDNDNEALIKMLTEWK